MSIWQELLARSDLVMQVFWGQLRFFGPWWLAGIGIGAVLAQLAPPAHWPGHRWANGPLGVVTGTLVGILSPLPLFGAIGLVSSLATAGLPAAPQIAFLIASPLLNPNLFVFTGLSLGWDWALVRAVGVLILGSTGGLLILLSPTHSRDSHWLRTGGTTASLPLADPVALQAPAALAFLREAAAEAWRVFGFSWRYFLLALILSAWVVALVPHGWVAASFGQGRWWGVPAAVLLSVPGHFCGGGALPVVHGLLAQGMSQGAGLAFLLAGPATSVRNLAALVTATNRRGLVLFLAITQGGATLLGLLLDLWA